MRVVWNAMALIKAGMGRFSVKGFNIGQAAREGMVFSESKVFFVRKMKISRSHPSSLC